MAVTCFWLEPAERAEVGLRRYSPTGGRDEHCPREGGKWGYHGALALIGDAPLIWSDTRPAGHSHWFTDGDGDGERFGVPGFEFPGRDDPRWPSRCECGYEFGARDVWQEWTDRLYRRADNGALVTLRGAPPGAMWDAAWYPWKGPDGRCLTVKCPDGGEWTIDGRASNCTMPDDGEHRCWVRHGEPPLITVDKNGLTCNAGGGSIQTGSYHGFLRAGVFS